MKVVKFGGSSLASATQWRKVANIILSDEQRKLVVVSAPGKRDAQDTKTTDLLIQLASTVTPSSFDEEALLKVVDRYRDIAEELDLGDNIIETIKDSLLEIIQTYRTQYERLLDALKASGEDNNAKLIASYFQSLGVVAHYVSPKDAGMIVTDEPGNARILPEAYERIADLRKREGILIIPGFFGYSNNEHIVTFPRGGSDITGSIIAAGVEADEYENFTDVDSIYSVNPNIVDNPCEIKELTYREMRELAYSGFSVFHDEALQPVVQKKVPVRVKNTNHPEAPGTKIIAEREVNGVPVVGIASDKGFCSINITKYLMNREVGFGRHLLEILEDEQISFEHTPSGIDNISVIVRSHHLEGGKEDRVINRILSELHVDDVSIERDLAIVMVVGEGMEKTVGIAAKATNAFYDAGVNIKMINQGSSEVSMMFGVEAYKVDLAVKSLYEAYFMK
ncbi:aspartate kinase [Evansella cellulosilytica]|uniref:Aspartokinase n=1 Tax=Evansella cellulosilytica (strain ATCC 21833 / DSM 2522 / FERM P-1141 / JCM 9156 / N-4) TaxID=649639 RepID=E6U0U4_EVAC2|nr:aspartate kinase [Evansella cellulosilytica]ADU29142.1 aspartate kinase [Evansella cellulosilytica DSM 2522]